MIGLGAEDRIANAELARASALRSQACAAITRGHDSVALRLVAMYMAIMASCCGYQGASSTCKLQDPHALVVGPLCRCPLCRSAASHLESHNAPLGAFANAVMFHRCPAWHSALPLGDFDAVWHILLLVTLALQSPRAGDWSTLVSYCSST